MDAWVDFVRPATILFDIGRIVTSVWFTFSSVQYQEGTPKNYESLCPLQPPDYSGLPALQHASGLANQGREPMRR